jgi:hypothetical protein
MLGIGQRSGFVASTNFADKLIAVAWAPASAAPWLSRRPHVEQPHVLISETRRPDSPLARRAGHISVRWIGAAALGWVSWPQTI